MTTKFFINPGLLAALQHFSRVPFDVPHQQTYFVFDHPRTDTELAHREHWTVERACGMAHELLSRNDLAELKLRVLVNALDRWGTGQFYERAMGEPISKALDQFK